MTNPIVLIVHPGAIGDVLLALKAIREIRNAFPSHCVMWIGQLEIGKLLLESEEVHEIIGIEGPFLSQLFMHPGNFDSRLKGILERCTHCVCWMTDHNGVISGNLQSWGISFIIQSPSFSDLMNVHYEERFMRTLHPWGIMAEPQAERMPLFKKVSTQPDFDYLKSRVSFMNSPYIVVHPGSGSPQKCVAPSLLGEMAERLLDYSGMKLVVLSGPADQCQVHSFLDDFHGAPPFLVSDQSLAIVAMLLKEAALYIGHDSGISHLAASVGTPSIVMFGPTNSNFWAPRGDHVTVIQGPTCHCAEWNQVQQCNPKPCLALSIDMILQKAVKALHHRIPLKGNIQISKVKSQLNPNLISPKLQMLAL